MPAWKVIGKHQRYIMFAEAYGWLPSWVDEEDPDVMDGIQAFIEGRTASAAKAPKSKK